MPTIAELLDKGRRTLLDLSARNRLLNIPQKSRWSRFVQIHDEQSSEVWRTLVSERHDMSFLPAPNNDSTPAAERQLEFEETARESELLQPNGIEINERGVAARHRDRRLQTRLQSEALQKRLLDVFYDAQMFIQEQGVNILYLALGQLCWYEDDHSDLARYAPLVLVPVKLERRSAAERFYLSWLEEDAQENLSLVAKLKSDFGIVLPEFKAGDDFELTGYISSVAEAVKERSRWEVLPNAITLGFFSFAKFLMYRDLDPASWPKESPIDANAFISALLRDGFLEAEHPISDDPEFDVDAAIPADRLTHVVDADSSQTLAIEAIRDGRNLVIQGPPGTGKSQTITNLIAAAVADGKTVLFVAEKLAALEVVKRRLDRIGLGDIALELHSNKSNKRAVLAEFKRVIERGRLRHSQSDGLVVRLEELRSDLNRHAAIMNQSLGASGFTVQKVLGHLVRLGDTVTRFGQIKIQDCEAWPPEERRRHAASLRDLSARLARIGLPSKHPWRGVCREALLRMDIDRLLQRILVAAAGIEGLESSCRVLASRLGRPTPVTFSDIDKLCRLADAIACAPKCDRSALASSVWSQGVQSLRVIIAEGRKFNAARGRLGSGIIESAENADFAKVRMAVASHGQSWFRIFSHRFREALAAAKASFLEPFPRDYEARVGLLDAAVAFQSSRRAIAAFGAGPQAWGDQWTGETSDWDALTNVIDWIDATRALDVGEPVRFVAARLEDGESIGVLSRALRGLLKKVKLELDTIARDLELDFKEAFDGSCTDASDVSLEAWKDRLDIWISAPENLNEWLAYRAQVRSTRQVGLGALVDGLEAGAIPADGIYQAFDAAYFEALLRLAVTKYPSLDKFDGDIHSQIVSEFGDVDRNRIELARVETLLRHEKGIPTMIGAGAMGTLKGEMEKKRNLLPLRRLFKLAGPAVQAIKPVFMMSPLSVAQYLEAGAVTFDLLLIDEASQVEPVDALGSIARSRQIVVVGDDKQLPPTRFFMRMTSEDTVDEDETSTTEVSDVESVLGLCVARGVPQAMLRWHYRSRHQSLIAVSNRQFYENKLFIVPSPYLSGGELGLKFNFVVRGVFDRGGKAQNKIEARTVAEAVMYHAQFQSHKSLGVAAFSLKQAQAIRDEVELLRRQRKGLEGFFAGHEHEPFFVKNLESVQGDERDVIFISVGYGKDASGFMSMSFGPLNSEGGERRLNVLISRAKLRCEVFSSIHADDIDTERARGAGIASLKVFLKFAETGQLDVSDAGGSATDSPFEDSVKNAIEVNGHDVRCQVGIAGFFIDLAIVDPEQPGRYLLGIECDGAAYHSSRSARDRDRLRQQVLEDHGWTIHRIWSSDWFNKPQQELRKVLAAINSAKLKSPNESSPEPVIKVEFDTPDPETISGSNFGDPAPAYVEANFAVPTGSEPHEVPTATMAQIVGRVVDAEGPIHEDEIVTRVRTLWGLGRAGNRIQRAVRQALSILVARNEYCAKDNFWTRSGAKVSARDRSNVISQTLRRPELISQEEMQAAILDIICAAKGATPSEIPQAVARRLGFSATSSQLREKILSQVAPLVERSELSERAGLLILHERSTRNDSDLPH